MENKLYTVTIFAENHVGLLNQVSNIFTRRKLNIETLSVSASAIEGIHKFTITVNTTADMIIRVIRQIDKRVDVLKSYYNVDDELIYQEIALFKISTSNLIALGSIESLIRKYDIRILEINDTFVAFEKTGHTEETRELFKELSSKVEVLQFIRSGKVAITKSKVERLSDMLAHIESKLHKK